MRLGSVKQGPAEHNILVPIVTKTLWVAVLFHSSIVQASTAALPPARLILSHLGSNRDDAVAAGITPTTPGRSRVSQPKHNPTDYIGYRQTVSCSWRVGLLYLPIQSDRCGSEPLGRVEEHSKHYMRSFSQKEGAGTELAMRLDFQLLHHHILDLAPYRRTYEDFPIAACRLGTPMAGFSRNSSGGGDWRRKGAASFETP